MLIRFHDVFTVKPVNADQVQDSVGGLVNTPNGLRAVINASHAGIITRNNGLYLPSEMKRAADGLNQGYKKPFLVHHDKHADPIGRIVNARYVDTSTQALQVIQNSAIIKTFNDALEVKRQLPAVDVLRKSGVLYRPEWEGLGYLQIEVVIPDREAAQKFLDGRYQTVSVGLTAGAAICSLTDCHKNWADEDGRCDHVPGKAYDNEKMFLIIGSFRYDEVSAVNTPADPFASVVEILNSADESVNDRVEIPLSELSKSEPLVYSVMDFTRSEALEIESTADKNFVIREHDSLHMMYDSLYADMPEGSVRPRYMPSQAMLALHAKFHQEAGSTGFRDDFVDGPLDVTLADFGVEEEHEEAVTEEAAPAAAVETLVEQEKPQMGQSGIWNPNNEDMRRTYHVPDGVVYPQTIKNEDEFNECLDFLEEDKQGLYKNDPGLLIQEKHNILKRGTIYNWVRRTKPNMNELEQKIAELEGKLAAKDIELAEKTVLVKDLEDKVYVLRDELRIAHCDNKALEDREKELVLQRDAAVVEVCSVISSLKDVTFVDFNTTVSAYQAMDSQNLEAMHTTLLGELDLKAVRDKLFPQAGMTNPEPKGEVKLEDAQTEETPEESRKPTETSLRVAETYQRIKREDGRAAAVNYLRTLENHNLLKGLDLDTVKAMLE